MSNIIRRKLKNKNKSIRKGWDGKYGYLKTNSKGRIVKYDRYHNYKGYATDLEIAKYWR